MQRKAALILIIIAISLNTFVLSVKPSETWYLNVVVSCALFVLLIRQIKLLKKQDD